MIGLVWNTRNELGAGFLTAEEGEGITDFARDVISEASKLGILIDVAHFDEPGVRAVLETTDRPMNSVPKHPPCFRLVLINKRALGETHV